MAHYQCQLTGDVDAFVTHLDRAVVAGSISAASEGGTDLRLGDARMVVRVYERYSAFGGNRVSMTVSVLAVGDQLAVSVSTAGGSTAVFWKINTVGEGTSSTRPTGRSRALPPPPGSPEHRSRRRDGHR